MSKLEEIKSNIEYNRFGSKIILTESEYNYLIQRAERVEELELEVSDWRVEVQKWEQFYEESERRHLITRELLHSAISEIKRYREALNSIITLWTSSTDATDDRWLAHKMSETARQGLEGEK